MTRKSEDDLDMRAQFALAYEVVHLRLRAAIVNSDSSEADHAVLASALHGADCVGRSVNPEWRVISQGAVRSEAFGPRPELPSPALA
jgi:hypothetical protein